MPGPLHYTTKKATKSKAQAERSSARETLKPCQKPKIISWQVTLPRRGAFLSYRMLKFQLLFNKHNPWPCLWPSRSSDRP